SPSTVICLTASFAPCCRIVVASARGCVVHVPVGEPMTRLRSRRMAGTCVRVHSEGTFQLCDATVKDCGRLHTRRCMMGRRRYRGAVRALALTGTPDAFALPIREAPG